MNRKENVQTYSFLSDRVIHFLKVQYAIVIFTGIHYCCSPPHSTIFQSITTILLQQYKNMFDKPKIELNNCNKPCPLPLQLSLERNASSNTYYKR